MTSVAGHLTDSDFEGRYRSWAGCPPGSLFEAEIVHYISEVCFAETYSSGMHLFLMHRAGQKAYCKKY